MICLFDLLNLLQLLHMLHLLYLLCLLISSSLSALSVLSALSRVTVGKRNGKIISSFPRELKKKLFPSHIKRAILAIFLSEKSFFFHVGREIEKNLFPFTMWEGKSKKISSLFPCGKGREEPTFFPSHVGGEIPPPFPPPNGHPGFICFVCFVYFVCLFHLLYLLYLFQAKVHFNREMRCFKCLF